MLDTLLLILGASSPALAPVPSFQDDDPEDLPDEREVVEELVDELEDHVKARGEEDDQAIEVIDTLVQEFQKSGLKDRETIAEEIGDCLKQRRREVDGVKDNRLYLAAAEALGTMGPESVRILDRWVGHKQHKKDLTLQATLIRSLGKTKSEKAVDTLTDLLNHHEAVLQAAAADALGNYTHLESDDRKEVFEEVLKILTGVYNRMEGDPQDIIARERYDVIAAPMTTTLQALSGHDERHPPGWRSWWNDNKRKDWDEEG